MEVPKTRLKITCKNEAAKESVHSRCLRLKKGTCTGALRHSKSEGDITEQSLPLLCYWDVLQTHAVATRCSHVSTLEYVQGSVI